VSVRLIVVAGPDAGATFTIVAPGGTIGRAADATVKLGDVSVSRRHCEVRIGDGGAEIVHAGGPNPTRVNGIPIERAPLAVGDEVELGATVMRIGDEADDGDVVPVQVLSTSLSLDTRELSARPAGDPLATLVRLGDALHRAATPGALVGEVGRVMGEALRADRVSLVVRDAAGRLSTAGDGRPAVAPTAEVTAAIAHGQAAVVADRDRQLLVVPLAPADGVFGVAGAMIAERALDGRPAWQRRDVELASAAARLAGASLGALSARERSVRAVDALASRVSAVGAVLGRSPAMQELAKLVGRVAAVATTVLIEGESGSGKEWVAEAIHAASPRAAGPLVSVNCGALSESLIEGELFGHERGAFTGATERRAGRFEQADGGSLFLDEIGELSEAAQAKLLRVLETRRFERVGGTRTIAVDVRVIAATNRDLAAMVKAGRFREDLYFRVAVIRAAVPPLRERPEDVLPLAEHFLARFAASCGRRVTGFTAEAVTALEQHWWPGNVRELRNTIERAAVLGDGVVIDADDLGLVAPAPAAAPIQSLQEQEKAALLRALDTTGGNKAAAAKLLGIDRTALYKKLRRFGLR